MTKLVINNITALPFELEEALTQLKLNLSFSGSNIKTVMISSSMPNEGKSFVTLHLWKMMAELGIPVLYIDMDFRKSMLRSKYGIKAENGDKIFGSADYLSGQVELDSVVYQTNIPNGDMMPVVHNIVNPAMLLNSPHFGEMIKTLSSRYKYILVDTPPIGSVTDALSVAPWVDGVVLVVRSGVTSRRMVDDSLLALKRAGTPFLGFVLNRMEDDDKTSAYYRRNYHSYYKYGKYGKYSKYSKYGGNHYYGKN